MLETILNSTIEVGITLVFSIASAVLIPAVSRWLSSKTENEKIKSAIEDITHTVQTSVGMIEQTMVSQLKSDGKWDTEAQTNVLKTAVTDVVQNLANSTRNKLKSEEIDVEQLVTRYIESYIQSKKE